MKSSLSKLRKKGAPDVSASFQKSSQLFPEEESPGDTSSDAEPISLNPEDDDSAPAPRTAKRRKQRRDQQNQPETADEDNF